MPRVAQASLWKNGQRRRACARPQSIDEGDDAAAGAGDRAAALVGKPETLPRTAARSDVAEAGGLGILAWHPLSLPAPGTRNMPETFATPQGNPLPIPSESRLRCSPSRSKPLGVLRMFSDSSEVLKFIKDTDVKFLDIRFTDLPGVQQHFNIPASTVDEEFFSVGQLFDGSSIRGFAIIHESDMQLIPDVTTAYVDPFRVERTLIMVFDIYNPRNGEIYAKDPRQVAKKAEKYLASTGIADTAFFAPEAEFYIFDDVRYEVNQNSSFYSVDSEEGAWNSGREEEGGNLANKTPYKGGYFPVSPVDKHGRPARRHLAQADRRRPHPRARAPRGRHRRPGGDQLPLRHDGARGRRHPEVQVHRQEHGRAVGQDGDVHAEAALRRQRLGHAHPPVALERRQAAVLRRGRLRRALRHRALVHRRPAQARPRGARLHEPDGELATTAWSPASRPRSTWSTRPATARRRSASRSRARTRRRSASSSARRTPRATRTSRSPRS